jgi:hypothetical protein
MEVMWQGLSLLEQTIRGEERIAKETPKRFGATRKTGRGAAELAAIGWIAEGFQRAVGRADWKSAAKLAELVLQCPVSTARIREAFPVCYNGISVATSFYRRSPFGDGVSFAPYSAM